MAFWAWIRQTCMCTLCCYIVSLLSSVICATLCAKLVTKFTPPLYNALCMSLFDSRSLLGRAWASPTCIAWRVYWTECYPIHFLETELVLCSGFHSYYPVLEDYWESQLTASRTMSFCCCLAAAIRDLTVFIIAGSLPSPGPMTSACSRGSHEPMASLDWEHWPDLQERGGSDYKEWCRMLNAMWGQCAHSNGWTISSGL